MWRLAALVLRVVLAPKVPWLRLIDIEDSAAQRAYSRLLVLAGIFLYGLWGLREVRVEYGITGAPANALGITMAAVFFGTIIFFIWQRKRKPSDSVEDDAQGYLDRNAHILASIGVVFIFVFALGINLATGNRVMDQAIASLILLGSIPVIDRGLRRWISRLFHTGEEVDRLEMIRVGEDEAALADDAAIADTEASIDELSAEQPVKPVDEQRAGRGKPELRCSGDQQFAYSPVPLRRSRFC